MTKEALQQALEALNKLTDVFLDIENYGDYERKAIYQGNRAIDAIKKALAQRQPLTDGKTIALVKQCRDAFAEELGAYDIQPPIQHLHQGHADCVAWLAAHGIGGAKP